MSDERLRELERRWKETGAVEDEAAWLVERIRVGEILASQAKTRLAELADAFRDHAGTPIDPGIRTAVLNLWALGFWTSFSCEGHVYEVREEGWSFSGPRVVVELPSPFERHPLDVLEGGPTPEEQTQLRCWMVSNLRQQQQAVLLLEKLYRDRKCPLAAQLILCPVHHEWGVFSLQSLGADASRVLAEAEQQRLLPLFQAEMRAFADFLGRQRSIGGAQAPRT